MPSVQALGDLINEVTGYLAREKELALLREISGKLDLILEKQARILKEIEALKIFISEHSRNEIIKDMNSLRSSFASLSKDKSDRGHRAGISTFGRVRPINAHGVCPHRSRRKLQAQRPITPSCASTRVEVESGQTALPVFPYNQLQLAPASTCLGDVVGRVHIVDDDESFRKAISHLRHAGYG